MSFPFLGCHFKLPLTEKVLAKCGLNGTESSISTKRSRCFFNGTKLQKMWNWKILADKYYKNFNFAFAPHFANTLLAVVSLSFKFKNPTFFFIGNIVQQTGM